jgi:hypothetical protein
MRLVQTERSNPAHVRSGELWLTATDEAVIVLVRKVRENGWGVIVTPVAFDIEHADESAFVLEGDMSPLEVPLVVYRDMLASLPLTALSERIVLDRNVNLLALKENGCGVTLGTPLCGRTDIRREIRKGIYERMISVDRYN